jgi:hypothetical protein
MKRSGLGRWMLFDNAAICRDMSPMKRFRGVVDRSMHCFATLRLIYQLSHLTLSPPLSEPYMPNTKLKLEDSP